MTFITRQLYRGVALCTHMAGWLLESTLKASPLPETALSRQELQVASAINGAFGDALVAHERKWAIAMNILHGDRVIAHQKCGQEADYRPQRHIIIFLHGLCMNEYGWQRDDESGVDQRWSTRPDTDILHVRYNTGLHIAENGRTLAHMLDSLLRDKNRHIERISLIGHSMGGLLARSACHYGQQAELTWTQQLKDVVCLGSPHEGAPLERLGEWVTRGLANVHLTSVIAEKASRRSAGIKDLRFGRVTDDPNETTCGTSVAHGFIAGKRYLLVASNWHPQGEQTLGDGLVPVSSALAGSLNTGECDLTSHYLEGVSHLGLLTHPEVFAALDRWIFPLETSPHNTLVDANKTKLV